MGNICRSPSAKGFFDFHVTRRELQEKFLSESAGTHGWHTGCQPDRRSITAAARWGVDISHDVSRLIEAADFNQFDWILAMDSDNLRHMEHIQPTGSSARLQLLLELDPDAGRLDVPDPYYGGEQGFDKVCQILHQATARLLDQLEAA